MQPFPFPLSRVRRSFVATAGSVAIIVALAACSGAAAVPAVPTAPAAGGPGASGAPSPGASVDPRDALVAYTGCMREHGVDFPDPVLNGDTSGFNLKVDPNTPASTKVRAADSILDHAAKSIEIEDIEARVAELERAAQGSKGPRQ